MKEFNLKNKFKQLSLDWKIDSKDSFNFAKYVDYLNKYDFAKLDKPLESLNLPHLTKILNKVLDFIFTFNYIGINTSEFSSILTLEEKEYFKKNGFKSNLFNNIHLENYKNKKELIINFQKNTSNKISNKGSVIRINFSLLDQKYSFWNSEIKKSNLISIINSLDKHNFLWSYVDIKKQYNKKDLFFACVNLEVYEDELCESSLNWLQNSNWSPFFNQAQEQLRIFCYNNKIPYHHSFTASKRMIDQNLKNINFKINEKFINVYYLFIILRTILTNPKNKKYSNTYEQYLNACKDILELLKQKAYCLNYLIYANKKIK